MVNAIESPYASMLSVRVGDSRHMMEVSGGARCIVTLQAPLAVGPIMVLEPGLRQCAIRSRVVLLEGL